MDSQIIYVSSEAQRHKMADDACARHNNMAPMDYNPRGIYKCCGVNPEYRNGGAVLGSFTCPVCKRHEGIWSQHWPTIFNNWNNNTYRNTWRQQGDLKPVNKENFIVNIEGYNEGWRYINVVRFNLSHKGFSHESYDYHYKEYSEYFDMDGAIVRYNVDTNIFEFWYNNELFTLEYNPPKSGGCISYGFEGTCIIDNDKEHKYAKHHNQISFSAFNYKWSNKLQEFVEKLKK